MNLKTSFVLAILFILLGSFAVFDPMHWKEKKEVSREKANHVLWLKDVKFDSLVLHARDIRTTFTCAVKDGCSIESNSDWNIVEPVQDSADIANMGAFLSSLKNLAPVEQSAIEPNSGLAEYGLEKPQAMVDFKIHGQNSMQYLKLGMASPIGSNIYGYSSMSPGTLFLVENHFAELVKKDIFYWRNKKLIRGIGVYDVQSLSWKNKAGKTYSFSHKDNQWRMNSPLAVSANQVMVEGLLNSLLYSQSESIAFENKNAPEAQKILRGKTTLTLRIEAGGQKEELSFFTKPKDPKSKPAKELFYVSSISKPNIVVVDASIVTRFEKDLAEFRNRHLLTPAEMTAVDNVEFHFMRDKKHIVFQREGTTWRRIEGEMLKSGLSQARMKNFLDALSIADIKKYDSIKLSQWSAIPELELVLKDAAKKEIAKRHFVLTNKLFALTEGELKDELRVMGEDFLKVLPIRLSDLEESTNKQVIVKDGERKEHDEHGH